VQNSTLSGNSTSMDGGGIYNEDTLTVQNSTLSNNLASFTGGGIYNMASMNYENTIIATAPPAEIV